MCGKIVKGIPARLPRRSNSVPKLLADIGPPRSLVNTYGDASCSRCRRRRARISSPCIGCTDGVPFLLLRTCSRPVLISIWCHCRSHSSKPVAVGQQDHGGVPVAIAAVLARGLHELLERAPVHVWMAPAWQEIIWRAAQRSLAVMCPACWCSPGGLLALMGSANRVLIIQTGSMSR